MNMILRVETISRSLLVMLCIGGALVACTTQEATPGGTGGKGAATGTGGSTAGTGGSVGSAETDGIMCPLPTAPLITNFTYVVGDAGATATDTVHFGDSTTLGGSEFVYPTTGTYLVTSDVTQNNWHISGTLGDYSGFGLFFDNCNRVNASAYRGIQFTISGSVPQGGMITLGMGTLNNVIASSWLMSHGDTTAKVGDPGRCTPPVTAANKFVQTTCADATKAIPVTATPTVQQVLWNQFTGGKPDPLGVTPTDIISFYWFFPPPVGAGTPTPMTYPVDIVIDDLSFVP